MTDKEFRFDEDSHTYWLGKDRLPSVTEIIGKSSYGTELSPDKPPEDFDGDAAQWAWVLNRAGEIGNKVHQKVSEHHLHGYPLVAQDRSANAYLRGYRKFVDTHDFDVLLSEQSMYCPCHMVAGTVDLVVWHDGQLKVWDLKTTNVLDHTSVALQTAAYAHLFEHHTDKYIDATGVVHLVKDGIGYNLVDTTDPEAFGAFEEAIDEYRNNE